MGLFGFGKKKTQEKAPQEKEQAAQPVQQSIPSPSDYMDDIIKSINEKTQKALKTVFVIPNEIDNMTIAYSYRDVNLESSETTGPAKNGDNLTLKPEGDRVAVYDGSALIGLMKKNRLAGMVVDWQKAERPYVAKFVEYGPESPVIALYFYDDCLGKYLQKNQNAKMVKLTGKPDDLASYSKGRTCEIEKDYETEKYNVMCDQIVIGRLPSSALTYAEKQGIDPEDLSVIVADVEYDLEKDRDVISVYISE